MKWTLIPGGAGFLVSHFCDRLLKDGHDVLCGDNCFAGSRANITHLIENLYLEQMQQDMTFLL